jgi:type II secretory pathway pseudopilin PulG
MKKSNAFSAIELLIAIAVIVILSIISVPKITSSLIKANENATKASLGALRTAIAMYYGDHDGEFPTSKIAQELTGENGKYVKEIPAVYCPPYHKKSNIIITSGFEENKDSGYWAYKPEDADDGTGRVKGQIWILCTHRDSKGNLWSEL